MRLLYKPIGILAGLVSVRISRRVFNTVWAKIDAKEAPPTPRGGRASTTKVVAAAAIEAATSAGTSAAVDRAGARVFHYLIGVWPEKPPKVEDADA